MPFKSKNKNIAKAFKASNIIMAKGNNAIKPCKRFRAITSARFAKITPDKIGAKGLYSAKALAGSAVKIIK